MDSCEAMGKHAKARGKIKNYSHGNFSMGGFSLLELSFVLVVIGFITAGLQIGQSVVRNASLKSVITDIEYYKTSIRTFKDTYGGLPGDLPHATVYWPNSLQKSGFATANGDGNGRIEEFAAQREDLLAWQHLALAGMIKGDYEGAESASGESLGYTVPESKITGGGYWIHYSGPVYGRIGNFIEFASDPANQTVAAINIFSADNAYASTDNDPFLTMPLDDLVEAFKQECGDEYMDCINQVYPEIYEELAAAQDEHEDEHADDEGEHEDEHVDDEDDEDSHDEHADDDEDEEHEHEDEHADDDEGEHEDDEDNDSGDSSGSTDSGGDSGNNGGGTDSGGDNGNGNNGSGGGALAGALGGAIVSPQEARAIDDKIDDGKADSGDILATDGVGNNGCVSSGSYSLGNGGVSCRMHAIIAN